MQQMIIKIIFMCCFAAVSVVFGSEIAMAKMPKESAALSQKKCTETAPECPKAKKEKDEKPIRCEECQKKTKQSKCKSAAKKVVEGA